MNMTSVLLLAVGIGIIAGLRSFTAPAVVCWMAHLHVLNLQDSHLRFMGSTIAVAVFTLLALAELINDKLPKTPSRVTPFPLTVRILTGALSGAAFGAGRYELDCDCGNRWDYRCTDWDVWRLSGANANRKSASRARFCDCAAGGRGSHRWRLSTSVVLLAQPQLTDPRRFRLLPGWLSSRGTRLPAAQKWRIVASE
jgi:hypothetical protein